MTSNSELRSGKGHRDENFPVASHLVAPRHRATILAFYNFARAADDVADHADLEPAAKLSLLDGMESALLGEDDRDAIGVALRFALSEKGLSPQHAQDLLVAFRRDVTKLRYANWDELIDYCRYSAMPVGRFVLDVHGESRATWPANDALCAALQIINHLQDCAKDLRAIDRVYVPLDALQAAGLSIDALREPQASPALRACLSALATKTGLLLDESAGFSGLIRDFRLGLEVAVIHRLARTLNAGLKLRDPLSEKVHLGKAGVAMNGMLGVADGLISRLVGARAA